MTRECQEESLGAVWRGDEGRSRRRELAFLLVGSMALMLPGGAVRALQADWLEHVSPAESVTVFGFGASRVEAHEYLEGVGLIGGAVADPEISVLGSDAFHATLEAEADWALQRLELDGRFALRRSGEVLGRAMTVTSVVSSDGLQTKDDLGGSRVSTYRRFPAATCQLNSDCDEVASFDMAKDDHGTIVEFIRDRQGFPSAVRFGETLLLRYDFTPPLPEPAWWEYAGDRWRVPSSWELIDLRSSEIVIDSADAAEVAVERPMVSVRVKDIGEVLRFEGGEAFAVAQSAWNAPYALLSLERTSEVWRLVGVSGDRGPGYGFRVDYTDHLVRVRIAAGGALTRRSIVVEAPRSRQSLTPVSFVHPGSDMLTAAMRSGVRLRAAESLDAWLVSTFQKESLPVVLRQFHAKGIDMGAGLMREAAASTAEPRVRFAPAGGCEEKAPGIVCVVAGETPYVR